MDRPSSQVDTHLHVAKRVRRTSSKKLDSSDDCKSRSPSPRPRGPVSQEKCASPGELSTSSISSNMSPSNDPIHNENEDYLYHHIHSNNECQNRHSGQLCSATLEEPLKPKTEPEAKQMTRWRRKNLKRNISIEDEDDSQFVNEQEKQNEAIAQCEPSSGYGTDESGKVNITIRYRFEEEETKEDTMHKFDYTDKLEDVVEVLYKKVSAYLKRKIAFEIVDEDNENLKKSSKLQEELGKGHKIFTVVHRLE